MSDNLDDLTGSVDRMIDINKSIGEKLRMMRNLSVVIRKVSTAKRNKGFVHMHLTRTGSPSSESLPQWEGQSEELMDLATERYVSTFQKLYAEVMRLKEEL